MTDEPAYSFTIPSIEDNLKLDCCVYHPTDLWRTTGNERLKGACIAHPYAPLGGSYDDAVVLSVKDALLDVGFIVTTFNFRGAGESAGRTSWTGQPEVQDYTSVAGFLVYYVHGLSRNSTTDVQSLDPILSTSNPAFESDNPFANSSSATSSIRLLLAGYSFGSLVLARLPPVSDITERFENAERGTAAGEIFLRARMLAKQTRASIDETRHPTTSRGRAKTNPEHITPSSPKARSSPVTVGGEETDASERRRSRDSKRSADIVRDVPNRIKQHIRRHSGSTSAKYSTEKQQQRPSTASTFVQGHRPTVTTSYLLISPVLLPFTTTLLPPGLPSSLALPFSSNATSGVFSWEHPILLLFGSQDTFTSTKRLRQWATKMQQQSSGALQWVEIDGAGHFWRENGSMRALTSKVLSWTRSNLAPDEQ